MGQEVLEVLHGQAEELPLPPRVEKGLLHADRLPVQEV